MSSPLDRELGPDEPSPFAPKRVRDAAERRASASQIPGNADQSKLPEFTRPDDGFVIDEYRIPRSLEPTLMPGVWPVPRSGSAIRVISLLVVAVAVAAVVGFTLVIKFQGNRELVTNNESPPSFGSRFSGSNFDAGQQTTTGFERSSPAQLTIPQRTLRAIDVAVPLNASVNGSALGATIVVGGLVTGSTLNVGRASGANGWRLSAADLGNALVKPPPGFIGSMDVALELRLADGSPVDHKTLRLEWFRAPAPQAQRPVVRQLDREEIVDLMRRGEAFIATGDFASARLVLQRASEAGDPRAALRLAGTYDPIVLEQQSTPGFAVNADITMARSWYERAKELGSAYALRRLESLASRNR
jgi:hypothetical protein